MKRALNALCTHLARLIFCGGLGHEVRLLAALLALSTGHGVVVAEKKGRKLGCFQT
jgi:hypothetical protein